MKRKIFGKKLSCLTALALIAAMVPTDLTAVPVWADELIAEEAAGDELLTEAPLSADDDVPEQSVDQAELLMPGEEELLSEPVSISDEDEEQAADFPADKLEADAPAADTDGGIPLFEENDKASPEHEVREGSSEAQFLKEVGDRYELIYYKNGVSVYCDVSKDINNFTYNTYNQTLCDVIVFKNNMHLDEKTDYTCSYKNNKNAGTALLIIKPAGNYTGASLEIPFTINPRSLIGRNEEYTWFEFDYNRDRLTVVEDGKVHKPDPGLYMSDYGIKKYNLKPAKTAGKGDYMLEYPDKVEGAYVKPGCWTVKVTGTGNYTGVAELCLTIKSKESTKLISKTKVTTEKKTYTYDELLDTSSEYPCFNIPKVTVTDGNKALSSNQYRVEYFANPYAWSGKRTIAVYGTGETSSDNPTAYYGYTSVTIDVTGTKVTSKNTEVVWGRNEYVYEGDRYWLDDFEIKVNGKPLERDKEWYIYSANRTPDAKGNVKATIKFNEHYGYTGTYVVSRKLKIHELSDFDYMIYDNTGTEENWFTYGSSEKQDIVCMLKKKEANLNISDTYMNVSYGTYHIYQGRDYTVKCKNNKNAGDKAYAEIIGMGIYKGKKFEIPYTVIAGDINRHRMIAPDVVYSTKPNAWMSAPVMLYDDGCKFNFKAGTDYVKLTEDDYEYEGKSENKLPEAGTVVSVTVTGIGNFSGTRTLTYKITEAKNDISKATFKIANKTFAKYEAIQLEEKDFITALSADKTAKLKLGEDFEVYSFSSGYYYNKGTVKVVLKGIGKYAGMKVVSFKVLQSDL